MRLRIATAVFGILLFGGMLHASSLFSNAVNYGAGNSPTSVALGDFNGDSKPDILWQNTTTGQRYLWFMNGITPFDYADLGIVPVEWSIVK